MSTIRLRIENFRNIKSFDWTVDELCVLIGPNSSGKTNVCTTLKFLANCYFDPFQEVCRRFWIEEPLDSTRLQLEYQDVGWTVEFNKDEIHEVLVVNNTIALDHTMSIEDVAFRHVMSIEDVARCRAQTIKNSALFNLCAGIKILGVGTVYSTGSNDTTTQERVQHRFAELFSGIITLTDSSIHSAGTRRILSCLVAVEESQEGDLLIFDDFEQHLSPRAIQILIPFLRAHAEEHDCSIILTTHSPTVLNEFKKNLEDVCVLDQESTPHPIKLIEKFDRDWLVHFSPGDLLDRGILY